MTILRVNSISKRYGAQPLCDEVSFTLEASEHAGLIGPNGAGKSTLLRVIAGREEPDGGKVEIASNVALHYLAQRIELHEDVTVGELLRSTWEERTRLERELEQTMHALGNAEDEVATRSLLARQATLEQRLEHLGGYNIDHEIEILSEHLSLPPGDVKAGSLSGGEERRVALACALLEQPDLLLLDEPTNHLDHDAIEWFQERMRRFPGALLLVTHDRWLLDGTVTRMLELDRGELHGYTGNYQQYLEQRADRLSAQARSEKNRQAFLRRELQWIRRGPKARTTKAKSRVERFETTQASRPEPLPPEMRLEIPEGPRLGNRVLRCENVGIQRGGRWLVRGFSCEIGPQDRVSIVGRNGAGKTSLIEVLLGACEPEEGKVIRGPTVHFATLPQGGQNLDAHGTVLENVAFRADYIEQGGRMQSVRGFLDQLGFPSELQDTKLEKLSGGERRRVQVAKVLRQRGNVLVLDEPTNDLDLPTLRTLEEALVAFTGCMLLVSHDRFFLDRVATRVFAFEDAAGNRPARLVDHPGGFDAYHRAHSAKEPEAAPRRPKATPPRPAPTPSKRLSYHEKRELETLPARIEELESKVAETDAALADPDLYRSPSDETVRHLTTEAARLRAELEEVYARWTELEERQES